jgi:hypothetical protein
MPLLVPNLLWLTASSSQPGAVLVDFDALAPPDRIVNRLRAKRFLEMIVSGSGTTVKPLADIPHAYDRRLRQLEALRLGWDTYSAAPPNDTALNLAHRILRSLPPDLAKGVRVSPSAEGGVGISFLRNGRYADIECFNSGELYAVVSDRQRERRVWEVAQDRDSINASLETIRAWLG